MDWPALFSAVGLLMVLEGLAPFLSPRRFRLSLLAAASLSDKALRRLGLLAMVAGLTTLYGLGGS